MKKWAAMIAVVGLGWSSGCGSSSASCDFRSGSSNGAEPRCQEWQGTLAGTAVQGTCNVAQGKFIQGQCPREGVVGGCVVGSSADGSTTIDWYYAPMTVDEVKRECGSDPYRAP